MTSRDDRPDDRVGVGVPAPGTRDAGCVGGEATVTRAEELWPAAGAEAGLSHDRIGPYRILSTLGEGGMGAVYLAEQTEPIKRRVAIKLIRARRAGSREAVFRFEAERQALARMSHPNIAQVHEAGTTEDGKPYIVMEHVAGEPIHSYCDRHALTVAQRLELFVDVCMGVQHAHQKGVIHRDLKPSNILVSDEQGRPRPRIIDFGIAKAFDEPLVAGTMATGDGVVGTPTYICPEAITPGNAGGDVDTRCDVYSLGVVLYELLTGVQPFDVAGKTFAQLFRAVSEDFPRPSTRVGALDRDTAEQIAAARRVNPVTLGRFLRRDLDWIILKAVARDRSQRYASAAALADDLRRHLRNEPVEARPPSTAYKLTKLVRRHTAAAVATTVAVLALVFGLVGTTVAAGKARREAARANREAAAASAVSAFLVNLFDVSDPGRARGSTVTARELLDSGARKIERELESQPLTRAALMETMGTVYRELGLYEEAKPLLEGSLTLREEQGAAPLEVASSSLALGELERERGHPADAERLVRRALDLRERTLGPEHVQVAACHNALGLVLAKQGRYDEAEVELRRSVAVVERALGSEHPELGPSLNNLALVLKHQADAERARGKLREIAGA